MDPAIEGANDFIIALPCNKRFLTSRRAPHTYPHQLARPVDTLA